MISKTLNFITVAFVLLLTGCVSVKVPKSDRVPASNISLKQPNPSKFTKTTTPNVDYGWINTSTGNSISVFTNCNDPSDPGLKSVQYDVLSTLESPEIIASNYKKFNGRNALYTQVKSLVDGYPTQFEIVILNKNKCIYIINYIASEDSFNKDYNDFDKFLKGFNVK